MNCKCQCKHEHIEYCAACGQVHCKDCGTSWQLPTPTYWYTPQIVPPQFPDPNKPYWTTGYAQEVGTTKDLFAECTLTRSEP